MRNMFGIFKIPFFGVFILLISTQTFAICEVELDEVLSTITPQCMLSRRYSNNKDMTPCYNINQFKKDYVENANRILDGTNEYYPLKEPNLTEYINRFSANPEFGSLPDAVSKKFTIAKNHYDLCILKAYRNKINKTASSSSQSNIPASQTQQAQQRSRADEQSRLSLKEQTENTLLADGAQQRAQDAQKNADESRKGKRRRHEPENEASHCIQPDFGGLYGGMKNTCNFKVWYTYCGYRPSENSWLTGMNCEKQSFGSDSVGPGRTSASHTKGVQMLYWIACKEPAWTVDTEFVAGSGIRGRCHTVGGN